MALPLARRLTAVLIAGSLVLAGCSGDDDEPAAQRSTTTTEAGASGGGLLTEDDVAGATDDEAFQEGLAAFQSYVEQQAGTVANDVSRFTDAVRDGDLETARRLYPASRQAYLRIEPLVSLIAPGVADVVEAEPLAGGDGADPADPDITGWHQLEYDLWVAEDVRGSTAVADQLDEQVAKLSAAVADFTATPKAMVKGTALLMAWAAEDAASGAAEPYSRTDMWDLAARVDAANAARQMFRGALGDVDPNLAEEIDDLSQDAIDAIEPFRTAEGWQSYDDITDAQRTELAERFQAFADALAQVPGALGLD